MLTPKSSAEGIHKEMTKSRQPTSFIRRARIAQGRKELAASSDESLSRNSQKMEAAWKIVCEIREETERNGKDGLLGRIRVKRERVKLAKQGAFEGSVWSARKVVEKQKKARFVEADRTVNAATEQKARKPSSSEKPNKKRKRIVRFKRKRQNS